MQATKQVASAAYEAVFQQPGWVEMDMQCRYCSKLQPNTPWVVIHSPHLGFIEFWIFFWRKSGCLASNSLCSNIFLNSWSWYSGWPSHAKLHCCWNSHCTKVSNFFEHFHWQALENLQSKQEHEQCNYYTISHFTHFLLFVCVLSKEIVFIDPQRNRCKHNKHTLIYVLIDNFVHRSNSSGVP